MSKSNELNVKGVEIPRVVYNDPLLDNDDCHEYRIDFDEAVRVVKASRGRALFVTVNGFAPSKNQDGVADGHTRGREVSGNVETTRPFLLRYLNNAYSKNSRAECYVRLRVYDNCLFVG